jgi:hypothetical protein
MTVQSATNFTVGATPVPTITSFTPVSGVVGTTVTITGTNFNTTPVNNTVRFNGTTATVTASSATSITTTVPSGATTGKVSVQVGASTATSATNFTVTVPSATITINPQPESTAICLGETTSFTLAASGTTNLTYQWQKFNGTVFNNISNGGGYTGVNTSTLTINTTGNFGAANYRCKISGDAAADVFSETLELVINPFPDVSITADGATLTATAGDSYQWYLSGQEISNATNQTYEFDILEYGLYTVEVTANGCAATSDEFVYLITGEEKDLDGLKVYPNPVRDVLFIESDEDVLVTWFDVLGKDLSNKFIQRGKGSIQTNHFESGTYILILKNSKIKRYVRIQKMN